VVELPMFTSAIIFNRLSSAARVRVQEIEVPAAGPGRGA
jgi:hypothetical protein